MEIFDNPSYDYRKDPAVPAFPDDEPVLFVDGNCTLCSLWARFVVRFDRRRRLRLCAVQSPLGRAVLGHFGLDPDDPQSWLCLVEGRGYAGMKGIQVATAEMGGWVRVLGWLLMLPPAPLRRWLYTRLARNRYRLLGRTQLCALPDPDLRARLIG